MNVVQSFLLGLAFSLGALTGVAMVSVITGAMKRDRKRELEQSVFNAKLMAAREDDAKRLEKQVQALQCIAAGIESISVNR